jgi:hypothetical protein
MRPGIRKRIVIEFAGASRLEQQMERLALLARRGSELGFPTRDCKSATSRFGWETGDGQFVLLSRGGKKRRCCPAE